MNFKHQNRLFVGLRYALLIGLLGFVSFQTFSHGLGNKAYPSIHSLCPFGGLESLLAFVAYDGAMLSKIFSGTMALFFVFLVLTLLFRRAFCGLLCPLGTMQELFAKAGQKIFKRRLIMPYLPDLILRKMKYFVLVLTVAMAWLTGTLWFQLYDPWTAYGHILSPDELLNTYLIGLVVLVISLIGSFVYDRFFCKYFCPLGAINAIIGKISRFTVKREPDVCINCSLCSIACPVNIDVAHEVNVTSAECISCGKCVAICPKEGALNFRLARWKVSPLLVIALVGLVYFGGIFVFQLAGYDRYDKNREASLWELAQSQQMSVAEFKLAYDLPASLPNRATASEVEYAIPFYKMAELNGMDPADLKAQFGFSADFNDETPWGDAYGEVTLERIATLNQADYSELLAAYGLAPETAPTTQWKAVREQVEAYMNLQNTQSGTGSDCAGE
ncbi:MAG: 4Fe-4S binding protein [Eubacteriales bacterium]|nr:4Fe-4S binding protein [Eubacteriales bacterium]